MAHKHGLDRVTREIELLIKDYPDISIGWYSLKEEQRLEIRRSIRKIIKTHIFTDEYWKAVAEDIMEGGYIRVESHLFKYVKKYVFRGNTREMLVKLWSVLEKNKR